MLILKIRSKVVAGTSIPKPEGSADFIVVGWGIRRGESALIYTIPNHKNPSNLSRKGITISEFDTAHEELISSGHFTRAWFNENLPDCAKEGSCNFTSIGGIFVLIGSAKYAARGVYERL